MQNDELRITLPLEGETLRMFDEAFLRSGLKSKTEFLRSLIVQEYKALGLNCQDKIK